MKRMICVFLLVMVLVLSWDMGIAGDFYVVPVKKQQSWDKIISGASRFNLVLLDGAAVLDRETGLVWQRATSDTKRTWLQACTDCYRLEAGGRMGWRLPTLEELATLVSTTHSYPALPPDHLFQNVKSDIYWSGHTYQDDPGSAWYIDFDNGYVFQHTKTNPCYFRCVRGGQGYDGQ